MSSGLVLSWAGNSHYDSTTNTQAKKPHKRSPRSEFALGITDYGLQTDQNQQFRSQTSSESCAKDDAVAGLHILHLKTFR